MWKEEWSELRSGGRGWTQKYELSSSFLSDCFHDHFFQLAFSLYFGCLLHHSHILGVRKTPANLFTNLKQTSQEKPWTDFLFAGFHLLEGKK